MQYKTFPNCQLTKGATTKRKLHRRKQKKAEMKLGQLFLPRLSKSGQPALQFFLFLSQIEFALPFFLGGEKLSPMFAYAMWGLSGYVYVPGIAASTSIVFRHVFEA